MKSIYALVGIVCIALAIGVLTDYANGNFGFDTTNEQPQFGIKEVK